MWVVALSALSSAGGLMSFGRGIFQAFMYFCFGLLGLSGMDILNLPVSRRGVRYFFLKCFLSDDPRKWNISVWLRGTEQYVNRFSILTVSAWGVTWGGMELPEFLQTGFFLEIFYRFRFPSSFPDLPFPFSQLPHFLFFVILEDWHGDHLFSETFTLRNASRISNSALRYTICDILSQIEVRTISYRAYCSHYLRSLATQAVLFLFHIADVFFLYLTSFQCLIFLI